MFLLQKTDRVNYTVVHLLCRFLYKIVTTKITLLSVSYHRYFNTSITFKGTKQVFVQHVLFSASYAHLFCVQSNVILKTLDTIGNCQRPVFEHLVYLNRHKITNLWKFELNWSSKLRDKNERKKNTLVTVSLFCCSAISTILSY